MPNQTIKLVESVLAEFITEAERSSSMGSQIAADTLKSVKKHVKAELSLNQDLNDRVSEIILPDVMPDPVAIAQKSGSVELTKRLKKLTVSDLKTLSQKHKLAAAAEMKGLRKAGLIDLLVGRCEGEAANIRRF